MSSSATLTIGSHGSYDHFGHSTGPQHRHRPLRRTESDLDADLDSPYSPPIDMPRYCTMLAAFDRIIDLIHTHTPGSYYCPDHEVVCHCGTHPNSTAYLCGQCTPADAAALSSRRSSGVSSAGGTNNALTTLGREGGVEMSTRASVETIASAASVASLSSAATESTSTSSAIFSVASSTRSSVASSRCSSCPPAAVTMGGPTTNNVLLLADGTCPSTGIGAGAKSAAAKSPTTQATCPVVDPDSRMTTRPYGKTTKETYKNNKFNGAVDDIADQTTTNTTTKIYSSATNNNNNNFIINNQYDTSSPLLSTNKNKMMALRQLSPCSEASADTAKPSMGSGPLPEPYYDESNLSIGTTTTAEREQPQVKTSCCLGRSARRLRHRLLNSEYFERADLDLSSDSEDEFEGEDDDDDEEEDVYEIEEVDENDDFFADSEDDEEEEEEEEEDENRVVPDNHPISYQKRPSIVTYGGDFFTSTGISSSEAQTLVETEARSSSREPSVSTREVTPDTLVQQDDDDDDDVASSPFKASYATHHHHSHSTGGMGVEYYTHLMARSSHPAVAGACARALAAAATKSPTEAATSSADATQSKTTLPAAPSASGGSSTSLLSPWFMRGFGFHKRGSASISTTSTTVVPATEEEERKKSLPLEEKDDSHQRQLRPAQTLPPPGSLFVSFLPENSPQFRVNDESCGLFSAKPLAGSETAEEEKDEGASLSNKDEPEADSKSLGLGQSSSAVKSSGRHKSIVGSVREFYAEMRAWRQQKRAERAFRELPVAAKCKALACDEGAAFRAMSATYQEGR